METRDTLGEREPIPAAGGGRESVDRFEMNLQMERTEEERVEEAAVLYEKAVRQRLGDPPPPVPVGSEEELEAMSQELKLRQMCQDIAAHIMVDEMEEEEED